MNHASQTSVIVASIITLFPLAALLLALSLRGRNSEPELPVFEPSQAAKAQGVCHTDEECRELYANIPTPVRTLAVRYLRSILDPKDVCKIRGLINRWGYTYWFSHLFDDELAARHPLEREYILFCGSPHFGFGMQIRNRLRLAHFGEQELGVHNLDCVYVQLLEDAVDYDA